MTLAELSVGVSARIKTVGGEGALRRRLLDMGLTPGTTVMVLQDDGYEVTYAGLQEELSVAEGDRVTTGQEIGMVGNTTLTESALGAHLHFAVSLDGEEVDPAEYLPQ